MLSTKQAAEMLGVNSKTLYLWLVAGKVNGIRIGRNYKISKEEVEYIKKNGLREN